MSLGKHLTDVFRYGARKHCRGFSSEPVLSQLSRVISKSGTEGLQEFQASHPDAAEQRRDALRRLGAQAEKERRPRGRWTLFAPVLLPGSRPCPWPNVMAKRVRRAVGLLALFWAPAFLAPKAPAPSDSGSDAPLGFPRRSLGLLGLLPGLGSSPVRAEQGWQLKLPRRGRDGGMATALVVAGNPNQGAELVVLRVPLSLDPADPNAKLNQDLVKFFTTKTDQKSSVSVDSAAYVLASSQKTAPGLTKWEFLEKPSEKVLYKRRYIKYDYEASICPGVVTKGSKGDTCMAIEDRIWLLRIVRYDTSELPLYERRHRILFTVTDEGASARGEKDPTYYIWLLDISGPASDARNNWGELKEAITEVADSFLLSDSEQELEKARTAEVTPEQLKALEQLKKEGALPEDREHSHGINITAVRELVFATPDCSAQISQQLCQRLDLVRHGQTRRGRAETEAGAETVARHEISTQAIFQDEKPVRVAFLLLAYKALPNLKQLLRRLKEPWHFFLIHLDKKASWRKEKELQQLLTEVEPRYEVMAERFDLRRGGASFLLVMLRALELLIAQEM
eukprot:g25549.t1